VQEHQTVDTGPDGWGIKWPPVGSFSWPRSYAEAFDRLVRGGMFCNLEHVASPTARLHSAFYQALGYAPDFEDPSNHLLDVETQLGWLRDIGFADVDCYWKWLEMALLIGFK